MFDAQSRFFLKFLTGGKALPSKEEMQADTDREMADRWDRGFKLRHAHVMGKPYQVSYFQELADTAEVENAPAVVLKMYASSSDCRDEDSINYRKDVYKIIDDQTFVKYRKEP